MLRLSQAQVDEADDRGGFNLRVQELLVVPQQFTDCVLCVEGVVFSGLHRLFEKQVDPLSDVVLVDVVIFYGVFQNAVHQLADTRDGVLNRQVIVVVQLSLKWVDQTVD